jgi:hypothetical protein
MGDLPLSGVWDAGAIPDEGAVGTGEPGGVVHLLRGPLLQTVEDVPTVFLGVGLGVHPFPGSNLHAVAGVDPASRVTGLAAVCRV